MTKSLNMKTIYGIALLICFAILPMQTNAKAVEIQLGSQRWWDDTQSFEDLYRKKLSTLPKNSNEYKEYQIKLDHSQKIKCIVGRMYGLKKDSPEYKELFRELINSGEERKKKLQNLRK